MRVFEVRLPYYLVKHCAFLWALLGLGLFPALVSAFLIFGLPPWRGEVLGLVFLTALAHLLAFYSTNRMAHCSGRREALGHVAFVLFLFTLLLILFLALGQFYYSWAYLLLSILLAFAFFLLYLRLLPTVRLTLMPGGVSDLLREVLGNVLRPLGDLEEVEGVVVDLHHPDPQALAVLAKASFRGLPILHASLIYEGCTGRVPFEFFSKEELMALVVKKPGRYPFFKRAFEVGFVLLFSPLILFLSLLVGVLVYLDLGRPVIFAQERMGFRCRPFLAYKFRTMRGKPREGAYAGEEEARITPLGRFLRRYRLDELPQFWNVVKGDMNLIGPRPEQRVLAEQYAREVPSYTLRHMVPPGLTGWAQVQQGYAQGKEETWVKLSYDLYYVKYMSFWLDLRILFKTLWVLLTGYGAK